MSEVRKYKALGDMTPRSRIGGGEWVLLEDYDAAQSELAIWKTKACESADREAALREELARLKEATNFKDAVACVFDMLKYTAANTGCKEWDDQLEDLAEQVIEFAPEYKKQWKEICLLSASLTAAEQRNAEMVELLCDIKRCGTSAINIGGPSIQDRIEAAINPAESVASE